MTEPLMIVLTILSFVWVGHEIARRLRLAETGGFERWCAAVTIGAAGWIATAWATALLGQLNRTVMIVRTVVVVGVGVVLFVRRCGAGLRPAFGRGVEGRRGAYATPWVFIPVALWLAFLLWRAGIVPPLSHDALAYHLPRAVLWIREHGFTYFDLPVDARMTILPANYELLLADVILLGNGDQWTELIAIFFYVAFVIACGALVQRWWGGASPAVALLCAAVPVLLLHAGADKNDTMTAFLMVSAMVWAGRWITARDAGALLLCVIALAATIGTKPQGLMLALALAPILLFRRAQTGVSALRLGAILAGAFLLLGGVFYVAKFMNDRTVDSFVRYDDWENLWQAPWVLLTAPFSPSQHELYVPWEDRPWFWKRDEIYFSHLGVPFAICAVLMPVALWLFRSDVRDRARERIATSVAALATLLMMLPVRDVPMPHGVYVVALPRYVLFIVPIVFGLTIAPALARLSPRQTQIVSWVFAAWFVHQAVNAAINDRFVPIEYVTWARERPGTRVVPFDPRRASTIADRLAGPDDAIAFDAGYAAWIHPAFGAGLRRPVTFLARAEPVPDGAKWVIVDRSFPSIWQHKDFRDISQWEDYLGRGVPRPEDLERIRELARDPRFELVYHRGPLAEAVFRRR